MSVHWTPVATGIPHAKAEEMQKRFEEAGIACLPTESTSWIGKLRAFMENAPDLSLFVDRDDLDRAVKLVDDLIKATAIPQTVEAYMETLDNDQLRRLLKSHGWPDLILDPARKLLHDRITPPAPVPQHSERLPYAMGALCAVLGPIGSWISRQVIPRAQPWDDRMIPIYDEETQARAQRFVTLGLLVFLAWFAGLFVTKCLR